MRLWDTFSSQPQLLAVAPTPSTQAATLPGPGLRAVSALQVVPEHGMLVVGHSRGEVRAYQFWEKGRGIEVVALSEVGSTPRKGAQLSEEPGLQLKLRVLVHEAEITCVAYSPGAKCIAAGDKTGAQGGCLTCSSQRTGGVLLSASSQCSGPLLCCSLLVCLSRGLVLACLRAAFVSTLTEQRASEEIWLIVSSGYT